MLQRLLENRLFVKAEKCEFHAESVTFLGYVIESGQVKTDPEKIRAVAVWPIPENHKQLQRFLGFANFYLRFIRDFSRVAAPLTRLILFHPLHLDPGSRCYLPEAQGLVHLCPGVGSTQLSAPVYC